MKRGLLLSMVLSIAAALFVSAPACAFEREWHTGAGLGISAYPRYYPVGPALGLNAAYGISDVFDLKLELLRSEHNYSAGPALTAVKAVPYSAVLGLSYKLDVLQWIPYFAVLGGYSHISGALPTGEPFRRDDAILAVVLGLDYAVNRSFGLGASLRTDMRLLTWSEGEAVTSMLRAEYHWGF